MTYRGQGNLYDWNVLENMDAIQSGYGKPLNFTYIYVNLCMFIE